MTRSIRIHSALTRRRPVGARRAVGAQDDPNLVDQDTSSGAAFWAPVVTVGVLAAADAVLLAYGIRVL
nr:hypothetical protein [Microbacterium bovistercoris]